MATKRNKKKWNESGRSMIETLGVLVLLILLTLGGIQVFGLLYTNVVAKAVTESVVNQASVRRHAHMKKVPEGSNGVDLKGPYGYPMHVEDGVTGSLKNTFWVSVSLVQSQYQKKLCDKLMIRGRELLSQQTDYKDTTRGGEHWLGMIEIVVDGKVVTECTERVDEVKYLFAKRGRGEGMEGINLCNGDCCEICPRGGDCSGGSLECVAGYKKVAGGICGGDTCVACGGRECCGTDCPDDECPEGTKVNEIHTKCPPCTVEDNPDECGCPEGLSPNGRGGCGCEDDSDCKKCYKCDTATEKCEERLPNEECPECTDPEKPCYDYEKKECITCVDPCINDKDCVNCSRCDNNGRCKAVTPCPMRCSTESDCGKCQECQEGTCEEIDAKNIVCPNCPSETPCWDKDTDECIECKTPCASNKDCVGCQACGEDHYCNTTTECPQTCATGTDCAKCQDCVNNVCTEMDSTNTCPDCPANKSCWNKDNKQCIKCECTPDEGCGDGEVCDETYHYCCPSGWVYNNETEECQTECYYRRGRWYRCDDFNVQECIDGRCYCKKGYLWNPLTRQCVLCSQGAKCNCLGEQVATGAGACACPNPEYVLQDDQTTCACPWGAEEIEGHCVCKAGWRSDGAGGCECDTSNDFYQHTDVQGNTTCIQCPTSLQNENGEYYCPVFYCAQPFVDAGIIDRNNYAALTATTTDVTFDGDLTIPDNVSIDLGSCNLTVNQTLKIEDHITLQTTGNITALYSFEIYGMDVLIKAKDITVTNQGISFCPWGEGEPQIIADKIITDKSGLGGCYGKGKIQVGEYISKTMGIAREVTVIAGTVRITEGDLTVAGGILSVSGPVTVAGELWLKGGPNSSLSATDITAARVIQQGTSTLTANNITTTGTLGGYRVDNNSTATIQGSLNVVAPQNRDINFYGLQAGGANTVVTLGSVRVENASTGVFVNSANVTVEGDINLVDCKSPVSIAYGSLKADNIYVNGGGNTCNADGYCGGNGGVSISGGHDGILDLGSGTLSIQNRRAAGEEIYIDFVETNGGFTAGSVIIENNTPSGSGPAMRVGSTMNVDSIRIDQPGKIGIEMLDGGTISTHNVEINSPWVGIMSWGSSRVTLVSPYSHSITGTTCSICVVSEGSSVFGSNTSSRTCSEDVDLSLNDDPITYDLGYGYRCQNKTR